MVPEATVPETTKPETRPARACRVVDGGFSLIELLIAVAVSGVLCSAIAGGIVVVLRNMDSTSVRIADAQDAQNLVTWLPVDVSSAPAANVSTDPSLPSGCASVSPGTNILLLSWTETVNSSTTTFVADYRAVPVPVGTGITLQRFTCSGTTTLGASFSLNVSNTLAALPSGWAPGQAPVAVSVNGIIVTVTLTQLDGHIARVDSAQKNPAATLPPVPTTSATTALTTTTTTPPTTTSPPTTTTSPPTTVAGSSTTVASTTTVLATTTTPVPTTTIPCLVSLVTASPTAASVHSKAPGQLQSDVTVTIVWSGPCQLVQLQYDTGGSQGLLYQNFTTTSPYTVTLRGFKTGGTEIWSAGAHTLYVIDNNKNVLATTVLTVS